MDKRYLPDKIVKWYEISKRDLPWRRTKDPYKIWLSEIILQQTRVNQGLPYYLRFIEKYPDIKHLARAPEQEVLRLWQGLGYYTRARNLHRCAQKIVDKLDGRFPSSYQALLDLPGIGSYTAAAIASFSFSERVAVVDGNVFRVLSRIFGIDAATNTPGGKKVFFEQASVLVPDQRSDQYNQAIMEFGALICTPKSPQCTACIFKTNCFAFKHALQGQLPVKLKKKPARRRYFYYLVMQHRNSLAMKKREKKDIWMGLFDFHLVEKSRPVQVREIIDDELSLPHGEYDITVSKIYSHKLTHQTIVSRFIIVRIAKKSLTKTKNQYFYSFKEIALLPKPALVSRFLTEHYLL